MGSSAGVLERTSNAASIGVKGRVCNATNLRKLVATPVDDTGIRRGAARIAAAGFREKQCLLKT